ncbi:hypothetical protein VTI74DRAFT_11068 [Chaetomium olivicolor]
MEEAGPGSAAQLGKKKESGISTTLKHQNFDGAGPRDFMGFHPRFKGRSARRPTRTCGTTASHISSSHQGRVVLGPVKCGMAWAERSTAASRKRSTNCSPRGPMVPLLRGERRIPFGLLARGLWSGHISRELTCSQFRASWLRSWMLHLVVAAGTRAAEKFPYPWCNHWMWVLDCPWVACNRRIQQYDIPSTHSCSLQPMIYGIL